MHLDIWKCLCCSLRTSAYSALCVLNIYRWYMSNIYRTFSVENIGYFRYIPFLWNFLNFLMWHLVTMFWCQQSVFCWLITCALSIFSVLDNFCQIAPLHSNAVWMTRVLHLICKAHIHILLFGSKFYIFAMYLQMLDIFRKYRKKISFFIFSITSQYFPTRNLHRHWHWHCVTRPPFTVPGWRLSALYRHRPPITAFG